MPENMTDDTFSSDWRSESGQQRSQRRRDDDLFGGTPPYDETAEMAVLGGMLLSNDVIAEVSEILGAHDFYIPKHQTIFSAIIERFAAGEQVDAVLVADTLRVKQELEKVDGADYLASLMHAVPAAINAIHYADIVHRDAMLRDVIQTGIRITQMGFAAESADAEEVVNLAQNSVYQLSDGHVRQDYQSIGESVKSTLDRIEEIQSGAMVPGVYTGFRDIDNVTNGLQPGQMIVVAGRPGMGKSTIGIDFARHAALHENMPTAVFSLEMSKLELSQRIISAETGIPLRALREAENINEDEWRKLNAFQDRIADAPLYLDDSPNMSMMEIRSKCRRLARQGLRLVVIDYLQLMSSGKRVESRQQEVSEFSRSLKLLAKELEVPVVALSQLNRGAEARADRTPMISDLRESGSIEQDADVVMLVHRPDAYDQEDRPGEADIIMAKHRNGPTATFTLAFQGHLSRFMDMATDYSQGV
ncbi:replicative DNA helicase [Alloscardovia macacae]|uniref:Replicative DNA helicase n=2 Tax=Alloscardovia macacae TaxID=1160091 RepID=A0A1Y2SV64_9BIFI|nr:replicative DNA helicase [Alloscardovia macacae]OTA25988.1 replicative DNA helicase [Alloscardovia macacae]OTA28755.1 replicative DNA helicase [Alloscardovia macacae]